MKIGFAFYGIVSGERPSHAHGPVGSERDIRHCWPNIKKMLIDPFEARGHTSEIYFSTYPWTEEIEKYMNEVIKPDDVFFSDKATSDPFTSKGATFNLLKNKNVDLIVFSRCDVHYSKMIADENIDYEKFNFLFPEGEGWWERHKFCCDNFYIFPYHMTPTVEAAMFETYPGFPRGYPMVDTHGLWLKLMNHIPENMFHFISETPEISDINSFYTCCRSGHNPAEQRFMHLHPEVKERFYR